MHKQTPLARKGSMSFVFVECRVHELGFTPSEKEKIVQCVRNENPFTISVNPPLNRTSLLDFADPYWFLSKTIYISITSLAGHAVHNNARIQVIVTFDKDLERPAKGNLSNKHFFSFPDPATDEHYSLFGRYVGEIVEKERTKERKKEEPKKQTDKKRSSLSRFSLLRTKKFKYDVFLTHEWGVHERVGQINKYLKSKGINTWFDQERMKGNIPKQMAEGIENSRLVLVFVTKRYMEKLQSENENDNCLLEFQHAMRHRKSNNVHAVVLEKRMLEIEWTGPLGIQLPKDRMFIDLHDGMKNIELLVKKIKNN